MKAVFVVVVLLLFFAVALALPTETEVLQAARHDAIAAFSRGDYERWENWVAEGWLRVVTDPDFEFYRTLTNIDLQQAYRYALYLELNSLYFNYLDENPGAVEETFYNPNVKAILDVMPKAHDEIPRFVSSIREEEQVAALIKEIARTRRSEVTPMFVNARMTVPLNRYHIFLFPESWRDSLRDEIVRVAQVQRTRTLAGIAGIAIVAVAGISALIVAVIM